MKEIQSLILEQKAFFNTGQTKDAGFRKAQLDTLQKAVGENRAKILDALQQDLSKSAYEGYLTEVGIVLDEIRFIKKHLFKWAKARRVRTHLFQFPGSSYIYAEPYGVSLIISPWNYPFQLVIDPLIGSMAAGNCSVVKPSEYAPHTAQVFSEIISDNFDPSYIAVVEGEAAVSQALLDEDFDYIFFTGSVAVGKTVMQAAARHLTPVTLELGGKSPCIVDRDVNLDVTAKRICSGKFINAGQTCIAPDYLLVHQEIKLELLDRIKFFIHEFYGADPQRSADYPRIVNEKHFLRLAQLMHTGKIITGGQSDRQSLYIAPTIIDDIAWEDPIMQDEIFGPLLPVLAYDQLSEAISQVKKLPKPLAFYYFSNNRQNGEKIIRDTSFGGGCINDTLLHFANPHLPFGGTGSSGIGSYHGKKSFETFSHQKSILKRSFRLDAPLRYPPYGNKLKILEKIMR
ncbi:Aldehyde dehydrogenase (EC [Olavius sp. associated proteobacterium Delta 1]|nr:Aldehyde dehydrogenase (EC [Olavius sp. associated proteobacterium Delta 1]